MARPDLADAELDEIGIDKDIAAASFRRVFTLIADAGNEPAADEEVARGWYAVVAHAGAMFGEDTDEHSLTFRQFGDLLRSAYARGETPDDDVKPFEELPPIVQHAWMYVARHAANLFNMDDKEVRRLETHEAQIADLARQRFTTP